MTERPVPEGGVVVDSEQGPGASDGDSGSPFEDDFDGFDDFDEDEFDRAWRETELAAAETVREALAGFRHHEPPPELEAAGAALVLAAQQGDHEAGWLRRAAGFDADLRGPEGDPVPARDVLLELVAASVSMVDEAGLDPESEASLMALQHADWVAAIIGLVRAGAGVRADPAVIVHHISTSEEVGGPPLDSDDAQFVEHTFELLMPAWQVAGVVDVDRRLTEVGAWLLPRAACLAWDSDFDDPDDELDDLDDEGEGDAVEGEDG